MKLEKTENDLRDLEYQEEKLNDQKMEAFYIKEYISFFQEFESLFINEEIKQLENPKEDLLNAEKIYSPKHRSPSVYSDSSPRSPFRRSPTLKKNLRKMNSISPKKIGREVNMDERLSIVRSILQFHKDHPKLDEMVQQTIRVYNELIMQSNSLSRQYEEIMALVKIFLKKNMGGNIEKYAYLYQNMFVDQFFEKIKWFIYFFFITYVNVILKWWNFCW